MPFTLSHPAIILPLKKYTAYFSTTGLVMGSMAPDFEYFLRLSFRGYWGHTWLGLLLFDLPIGLLACFVFHLIARDSLIENMPIFRQKLAVIYQNNWVDYFNKHRVIAFYSLMIGTLSHFFWDGFTHGHGWFVEHINFLRITIPINGANGHLYDILQLLFSGLGLLIIIISICRLPKQHTRLPTINPSYWLVVALLFVSVSGLIFGLSLHSLLQPAAILVLLSSATIALVGAPLLLRIRSN